MLIVNGLERLDYHELIKFFKKVKDEELLVKYDYTDRSEEVLMDKYSIIENLFNRDKIKDLIKKDVLITIFNEDALLETNIHEVHRLSTTARIEKYMAVLEIEAVEDVYEDEEVEDGTVEEETQKEVKPKVKPVIETKTVAIGLLIEEEMSDIETITVNKRETRKAIDFLNEIISRYYIHKLEEYIRICVDYNEDRELEWLTVDELFERGIAK